MIEPKFTPGPWTVEYENGDERFEGQWFNSGPARIWFPYSSSEDRKNEAEANANLIAAAPELYQMLHECVNGGYLDRCPEQKKHVMPILEKAVRP